LTLIFWDRCMPRDPTLHENRSGEKKARLFARGDFALVALLQHQSVHLNCKAPNGLDILL